MLPYQIDQEVRLRLFTENDAEEFYRLTDYSRLYLKQWLGWLDATNSVEDTVQNIQTRFKELNENRGYPKSLREFLKVTIHLITHIFSDILRQP